MKLSRSFVFLGSSAALLLGAAGCGKSMIGGDGGDCTPQTCAELGVGCGQVVDNCGQVLDCAACPEGQTCGAAGPNACGVGTCDPYECGEAGLTCGLHADGCGQVWSCGDACAGTGGGGPGSGGNTGAGGTGSGGASATGGATACDYGTTVVASPSLLGGATQSPSGSTGERYQTIDVTRGGTGYKVITNGWGPNFQSHTIGWNGTALSAKLTGNRGSNGEPAGYPSVFCGNYAINPVISAPGCGLPVSTSTSIQTGMRWKANGNTNNFNVAWDIWLGNGTALQSYLMVWLHYPGGTKTGNPRSETPAGKRAYSCVTVEGVPGVWDIWAGQAYDGNGTPHPIINYVRPQGQDLTELEFDVQSFYQDALTRGPNPDFPANWATLVGSQFNAVAVGFELWNSTTSATPLQIEDFYVQVN